MFTLVFSERGGFFSLVRGGLGRARRDVQSLSCMVKGLPTDIPELRRDEDYGMWNFPDSHNHGHCYLEGLFAVDWDEDARTQFHSGFAPAAEVVECASLDCRVRYDEYPG